MDKGAGRLLIPTATLFLGFGLGWVISSAGKRKVKAKNADADGQDESSMPRNHSQLFHQSRSSATLSQLARPPVNRESSIPGRVVGVGTIRNRWVLVMVGLPARGKSYVVKMIIRYLRWIGVKAKLFNVGNARRQAGSAGVGANFFDAGNKDAISMREKLAMAVQDDMYKWLDDQAGAPAVAIFDATNTTIDRRMHLIERSRQEKQVKMLFVESICDDPVILARNYKMKLQNDDYKGKDPTKSLNDFMQRVANYEKVYEPLEDNEDGGEVAYIKLVNVGRKIITKGCNGYLPSELSFYLMNIHISPRRIWLTRHAESKDQVRGLLGRDSGDMTVHGAAYTQRLRDYIEAQLGVLYDHHMVSNDDHDELVSRIHVENTTGVSVPAAPFEGHKLVVLMGTQAIHNSTAAELKQIPGVGIIRTALLNELRGGELDGMSYQEIQEKYPDIWEERMKDKLNFRYPGAGGESYVDVIQRVKPIIVELERQHRSIIVISHLAVQRCLYAYFMNMQLEEIPYIQLPTHSLTELDVQPHKTIETHITLENTTPLADEVKRARHEGQVRRSLDLPVEAAKKLQEQFSASIATPIEASKPRALQTQFSRDHPVSSVTSSPVLSPKRERPLSMRDAE